MLKTLVAAAALTAAILPIPRVAAADAVPAGRVGYAAVCPGGPICSARLDSGDRFGEVEVSPSDLHKPGCAGAAEN